MTSISELEQAWRMASAHALSGEQPTDDVYETLDMPDDIRLELERTIDQYNDGNIEPQAMVEQLLHLTQEHLEEESEDWLENRGQQYQIDLAQYVENEQVNQYIQNNQPLQSSNWVDDLPENIRTLDYEEDTSAWEQIRSAGDEVKNVIWGGRDPDGESKRPDWTRLLSRYHYVWWAVTEEQFKEIQEKHAYPTDRGVFNAYKDFVPEKERESLPSDTPFVDKLRNPNGSGEHYGHFLARGRTGAHTFKDTIELPSVRSLLKNELDDDNEYIIVLGAAYRGIFKGPRFDPEKLMWRWTRWLGDQAPSNGMIYGKVIDYNRLEQSSYNTIDQETAKAIWDDPNWGIEAEVEYQHGITLNAEDLTTSHIETDDGRFWKRDFPLLDIPIMVELFGNADDYERNSHRNGFPSEIIELQRSLDESDYKKGPVIIPLTGSETPQPSPQPSPSPSSKDEEDDENDDEDDDEDLQKATIHVMAVLEREDGTELSPFNADITIYDATTAKELFSSTGELRQTLHRPQEYYGRPLFIEATYEGEGYDVKEADDQSWISKQVLNEALQTGGTIPENAPIELSFEETSGSKPSPDPDTPLQSIQLRAAVTKRYTDVGEETQPNFNLNIDVKEHGTRKEQYDTIFSEKPSGSWTETLEPDEYADKDIRIIIELEELNRSKEYIYTDLRQRMQSDENIEIAPVFKTTKQPTEEQATITVNCHDPSGDPVKTQVYLDLWVEDEDMKTMQRNGITDRKGQVTFNITEDFSTLQQYGTVKYHVHTDTKHHTGSFGSAQRLLEEEDGTLSLAVETGEPEPLPEPDFDEDEDEETDEENLKPGWVQFDPYVTLTDGQVRLPENVKVEYRVDGGAWNELERNAANDRGQFLLKLAPVEEYADCSVEIRATHTGTDINVHETTQRKHLSRATIDECLRKGATLQASVNFTEDVKQLPAKDQKKLPAEIAKKLQSENVKKLPRGSEDELRPLTANIQASLYSTELRLMEENINATFKIYTKEDFQSQWQHLETQQGTLQKTFTPPAFKDLAAIAITATYEDEIETKTIYNVAERMRSDDPTIEWTPSFIRTHLLDKDSQTSTDTSQENMFTIHARCVATPYEVTSDNFNDVFYHKSSSIGAQATVRFKTNTGQEQVQADELGYLRETVEKPQDTQLVIEAEYNGDTVTKRMMHSDLVHLREQDDEDEVPVIIQFYAPAGYITYPTQEALEWEARPPQVNFVPEDLTPAHLNIYCSDTNGDGIQSLVAIILQKTDDWTIAVHQTDEEGKLQIKLAPPEQFYNRRIFLAAESTNGDITETVIGGADLRRYFTTQTEPRDIKLTVSQDIEDNDYDASDARDSTKLLQEAREVAANKELLEKDDLLLGKKDTFDWHSSVLADKLQRLRTALQKIYYGFTVIEEPSEQLTSKERLNIVIQCLNELYEDQKNQSGDTDSTAIRTRFQNACEGLQLTIQEPIRGHDVNKVILAVTNAYIKKVQATDEEESDSLEEALDEEDGSSSLLETITPGSKSKQPEELSDIGDIVTPPKPSSNSEENSSTGQTGNRDKSQ